MLETVPAPLRCLLPVRHERSEHGGARLGLVGCTSLLATLALACGQRSIETTLPGLERQDASQPASSTEAHWEPLPTDTPFLVEKVRGTDMPCAISSTGLVACWGRLNPYDDGPAQLRYGTGMPMLLAGIDDAIDVQRTGRHLCVAQRAGDGACFSLTSHDPVARFTAPPVELSSGCARLRNGTVECIEDRTGEVLRIEGISGATSLACTRDQTCCATTPTDVRCFGPAEEDLGIAASRSGQPIEQRLPEASAIALDGKTACVLTAEGATRCWGRDARRLSFTSGARKLLTMNEGVCVLLENGTLQCASSAVPAFEDVVDGHGGCTAHADGSVQCWGGNEYGELGDGRPLIRSRPERVPVPEPVTDFRVAHTSSVAVTREGELWHWGDAPLAQSGSLHDGGSLGWCRGMACAVQPPASVAIWTPSIRGWRRGYIGGSGGPATVRSVAMDAGSTVCALDGSGALHCNHGMGSHGLDGHWVPLKAPKPVLDLRPLATGFCARLNDGTVSCFVDERYADERRFLDERPKSSMRVVPTLRNVAQLATGSSIACVLTTDSRVWCWNVESPEPRELERLRGASFIAAGHLHQCAIVEGDVWCWGHNAHGQLGNGTLGPYGQFLTEPVRAQTSFRAVAVGVGRESTCVLADDGDLWCWGGDVHGELGQGRVPHSDTPVRVVGLGPA